MLLAGHILLGCMVAMQSARLREGGRPTCGAANDFRYQISLKESEGAGSDFTGVKPVGRVTEPNRPLLRFQRLVPDSQMLLVQMMSSSLCARHVRIQV